MFDILNLIQVACLHLEEFVDRDAGTDGSYDDSKKENRTTRYGKFLPSHHHEQFWLMHIPCIKTASQKAVGNQCRQQSNQYSPIHKGTSDESP